MKRCSPSVILFSAFLIASCEGPVKTEPSEYKEDNLAQEAAPYRNEHGFWKNPDVDYIAVEVTVDDDDLSFWDVPYLDKPIIDTAPEDREDGLVAGEIGVDGGDKDMIVKLAQEIAEGQHGKYDSLLIAHKDKLIFESYYLGGRVNLTHPQVSATKAYTGLALGRAIQLGHLTMATWTNL